MYGGKKKELSGGEEITTNNRMELIAVVTALGALKEPCAVELYTDSLYIVNAIKHKWLESWEKRGWTRKDGELKNLDLWKKLAPLLSEHKVNINWIKGHAENEYNNRCDELAVTESKKHRSI